MSFSPTYMVDPNKNTKMRGHDRVFVLKKIDPNAPEDATGLVDKNVLTGKNRLHAIRDEASSFLWYFKYDHGVVPNYLDGRKYTKFDDAKKDAEKYFNTRNIQIEEVVD